ncbi:MAG TPA: hypothetical protein IAD13_05230 [Bacteroidetes bacterium]|nr:hypothetical protein [Candidatus Limimorpha avicola]
MTSLLFVTISYPVILGLLRDQEEESKHKAEMTMDLKEVFSCDDKMIRKQQEWKDGKSSVRNGKNIILFLVIR